MHVVLASGVLRERNLFAAASCITYYLKVLMDFEDDDGGEPVSVRGGVGKKRMFQINELLLSYFCHDQVHTLVNFLHRLNVEEGNMRQHM